MVAILVVDGDIHALKLVGLLLRPLKADVICAQGGQEALVLARSRSFDLVIIEVDLPGENGLAVVRAMRHVPVFGNTPILATVFEADGRTSELLRAGCSAWVPKPLDTRRFAKVVSSLLSPSQKGA